MTKSPNSPSKPVSYKDAGVDIAAGNALVDAIKPLAKATARKGSANNLGGFGGIFDLKSCGFNDPVLVAANDGVGTKLRVALASKRHDTVGIDLVAMSVNDLVVQGAEPLFFLDYFATGHLEIATATSVIRGIAKGCEIAGCELIGGETAEMPGMYHNDDYDLAGFAVGAVERRKILPKKTIAAGDIILGLASSGPHSNGYSLIRKLVENSKLDYQDAAPFAPQMSMGEALLTPTRIYVKPILSALKAGPGIKALAHITGGGLTENLPRVLPAACGAVIELDKFTAPAVFGWLQQQGQITQDEMLKTFNCGIGMMVVVAEKQADKVMFELAEAGEIVSRIGHITPHTDETTVVRYNGQLNFAAE